jgi:phosphoglycolate phosphatase
MRKRQIRNIIWDWNGTLLNDIDTCLGCMNILLKERSLPPLSMDLYREVFTFPVKDYFLQIGFDFAKEAFEVPAIEFVELYNIKYRESTLFSEARGTLQHFKNQGFSQFVLSAQEQQLLERLLKFYGIDEFFLSATGISDNFAVSKVEAGIKMMAELGLAPNETIMIGDTVHDYEVSRALGIRCLLISHGHQSPARLKLTGVPVLEDFFEIESYIANNINNIP